MRSAFLILLAAVTLTLTACGRDRTQPETTAPADTGANTNNDLSTERIGGGGDVSASALSARDRELVRTLVIYFDYDQADIKPEFNELLAAHGRQLVANPNMNLRLEGHTDERGSREYNIGLGERRAQAVRRVLTLQGVSAAQLTTVSYGEERPAQTGSDEESWRLNRRVELVYR
ncbi:MAG TPA: peptidoglycan-associated lipoprotein Pal [Gammaproteobacteria bacterium]|nr:peptidoglycan-associated lipoprotein Pal [Gammaproteobacteria bacterium]